MPGGSDDVGRESQARATGKPWRSFVAPDPDRSYVALATVIRLDRWRGMPAFGRHTLASTRQLARAPGIVGYTLRAAPHRRTFWTLSVWDDAAALARYVRERPHRDAVRWLHASGAARFRSTRWAVAGSELPVPWDVGLAHLEEA